MPYIKPQLREKLDPQIAALRTQLIDNFGEDEIEGALNYTFSELVWSVPVASADATKWRYKFINRVIGVLECVKQEFYRRLAGPYEDKAIAENGDTSTYEVFHRTQK